MVVQSNAILIKSLLINVFSEKKAEKVASKFCLSLNQHLLLINIFFLKKSKF